MSSSLHSPRGHHAQARWLALLVCLLAFAAAHPAGAQELRYPLDAVVDANQRILLADRKLPGILRIENGAATVVVQGSARYKEPLNAVWSVAIGKDGAVLVGDSAARGIFRIDEAGQPQKLNTSYVGIPIRMAVDAEGRIYVSDLETQRIWRFAAEGGAGEEFAVVAGVRGLAIDAQGRLWTARANPPQVVRYSAEGTPETIVDAGPLEFPHQIAVAADGESAFVADGYGRKVWKVVPGGEPTAFAAGDVLQNPTGLAWLGTDLLIVDPRGPAIHKADPAGVLSPVFPVTAP